MAKRKEIILQETLNTQEAWEHAMSNEKLYVVDAHQKWCGPCTAIVGMLKRIKNELGDDLLRFATAEVDAIDNLEQYRGKCEPNFLFFASGELVAAVRGCNAPLVQQTIQSALEAEHKVLKGEAERKVIRDMQSVTPEQEEEEEDEEEADDGVVPKQVTVALIKPDVVQNGQVDEILAKIEEAGIEVLVNSERMLSEEEAREFYKNREEEEFFDDLVNYITSGPCRVLVLTKGDSGAGVVELWRDIIGPFDAAVAKVENENSLRAIYGVDATCNAVHGSASSEEAIRELGFFFPDYRPPTYKSSRSSMSRASGRSKAASRAESRVQKTLAIIRPDALKRHKDAILTKIEEAGFKIAMQKEMTLSQEQAEDFYAEHKETDYFEPLVKQMTCGPVLALCLVRDDAVEQWRSLLGPKVVADAVAEQPDSLRAQFAVEEADVNMLHGSDSPTTAEAELSKIFLVDQTLAVIKPDAMEEKDKIITKLQEAGFMISCKKDMSLSRDIAEAIYKNKEGTDYYETLINHMTSGSTMMMVLSAEDAVSKLREVMGPTDPEVAKETHPESLRALFAKSILENAMHAPSTPESAKDKIRIVFGDTKFDWDAEQTQENLGENQENATVEENQETKEGDNVDEKADTEEKETASEKAETPADNPEAAEGEKSEEKPEDDEKIAENEATENEDSNEATPTEVDETNKENVEQSGQEGKVEAVGDENSPNHSISVNGDEVVVGEGTEQVVNKTSDPANDADNQDRAENGDVLDPGNDNVESKSPGSDVDNQDGLKSGEGGQSARSRSSSSSSSSSSDSEKSS
uniref:nucleoside-diphosphate kinase n=1 Tax=Phallusia mammillata TaxID=59560 RepID=A0A6F9DMW7_9ASCI|nr:CiIC3 thioredoxin domain-containing protein 3 homolog [Phallusia mammillata]